MTSTQHRLKLSRQYAVLTAATYGLLIFGASVRVHGAGLACPDWPLCFGEVVPPIDVQVGFEFGHRVVAGFISLAFLALGFFTLRAPDLRREQGRLWLFAATALVTQVVLGGLTVLHLLAEWTVTSHLVVGNTFCLTLLLITLSLRDSAVPRERPATSLVARAAGIAFAALLLGQLALGGLVSSSYAGLACGPTWPDCGNAGLAPTFEGLIGLQVTHRLVAYGLLAASLGLVALTRGSRVSLVVLAAVLVQAAIGIANVLMLLPVEITLAHTGGAAALVLATTWMNWELWRAPLPSAQPTVLATAVEAK